MIAKQDQPTPRSNPARLAFTGGLVAVLGALVATAAAAADDPGQKPRPVPDAVTWTTSGLDPALRDAFGSQRVEIALAAQPIVEAIDSPPVRRALTGPGSEDPRRAERMYGSVIAELSDEADATLKSQAPLIEAVRRLGGTPLGENIVPSSIVARVAAADLRRLAARPDVVAVRSAPRPRPLLNVATPLVGAGDWHAAGFTGGQGPQDVSDPDVPDVAMVGDAVDPTHDAFSGSSLTIDNQELPDDHGNHVGGVIASQDAAFPGAAPGIDTLIGAARPAYALGIDDGKGPGAADPAETINRSSGSQALSDTASDSEDIIVSLFGVGWATSAGNNNCSGSDPCDPGEGGAPSMSNIGHNQLAMAGLDDNGSLAIADDRVWFDSSRGPTPGGRKKPDLIAPADSIVAPEYPGDGFSGLSGTSLSAPFAASGMALLEGAGVTDPIAQRAILINSADPWDGRAGNPASEGPSPTTPQRTWQPAVGWGVLDLAAALPDRENYELAQVRGGEARFFRAATPTPSQKATLAWNMRGTWNSFPDQVPGPIVYTLTNLDLRQYDAATGTETQWDGTVGPEPPVPTHGGGPDALDDNDNVEQVHASATPPAETIYKVEAVDQPVGLAAEPFALASSEPLTALASPLVEPGLTTALPATPVACGHDVTVSTQVSNPSSDLDAGSAQVTLSLPPGVSLAPGSQPLTQTAGGDGTLTAAESPEVHAWTVRPTAHGHRTLTVTGSGTTLGTTFTRSENVGLTADCVAPSMTIDSGPAALGNDPSPRFFFTASEAATVECSIDGAPFEACLSPRSYPGLADGAHTFAVRGTDTVGNAGPAATRSFSIDTVAPDTQLTGPQGATTDQRPGFSFGSLDAVPAFECSLDEGPFAICSSPYRLSFPLRDGAHRFAARAIDAAGNRDPSPARADFIVDTEVDFRAKTRRRQEITARPVVKLTLKAREALSAKIGGALESDRDRFRLKSESVDAAAGERIRLELELRAGKDENEALRLLEDGETLEAELKVRARDLLGNRGSVERAATLESS